MGWDLGARAWVGWQRWCGRGPRRTCTPAPQGIQGLFSKKTLGAYSALADPRLCVPQHAWQMQTNCKPAQHMHCIQLLHKCSCHKLAVCSELQTSTLAQTAGLARGGPPSPLSPTLVHLGSFRLHPSKYWCQCSVLCSLCRWHLPHRQHGRLSQ